MTKTDKMKKLYFEARPKTLETPYYSLDGSVYDYLANLDLSNTINIQKLACGVDALRIYGREWREYALKLENLLFKEDYDQDRKDRCAVRRSVDRSGDSDPRGEVHGEAASAESTI